MIRRLLLASALLGASFALSGCASSPPSPHAPAADTYPLAVGDHWTYKFAPGGQTYTAEVAQTRVIDGKRCYAMVIDGDYSFMAVRGDGIYQYGQGEPDHPSNLLQFTPPQRIYKLPFVPGDRWATTVSMDPANPKSALGSLYGRTESVEAIRTPAGLFQGCARVMIDDPRDAPADLTEVWFAPHVGIVQTRTVLQRSGGLPPKIYETRLVRYVVG